MNLTGMKLAGLIRTSLLVSLLGTTALFYAQDHGNDSKPPQDDARPEATKPAREEAKPPRQEDAKPSKQDEAKAPANREQAEHAANRTGGHIPDDKFRAHFGRQHTLVINHPTIVEGQPRFQYGGYWFSIVDAWPVGWAYTDDCYIDYVDGEYFLFDLRHPGVRVAIVVVL
ncbi:MAG: hypothetical protein WAL76_13740 [Candidatus Sulfotelmatobacter sp.]